MSIDDYRKARDVLLRLHNAYPEIQEDEYEDDQLKLLGLYRSCMLIVIDMLNMMIEGENTPHCGDIKQ